MVRDRRLLKREAPPASSELKMKYIKETIELGLGDGMTSLKRKLNPNSLKELIEITDSRKLHDALCSLFETCIFDAFNGTVKDKLSKTFDETSACSLTGFTTRRVFDYLLSLISPQLKRSCSLPDGTYGCVAYFDLDHLVSLNELFGHTFVDEVIFPALGEAISSCFRKNDICGRLSGDEFCLITPGMSLELTEKHLATALKLFSTTRRGEDPQNENVYRDCQPSFTYSIVRISDPYLLPEYIKLAEQQVMAKKAERNLLRKGTGLPSTEN